MLAAVVSAFGTPPAPAEFPEPVAHGPHELVVDVLASGLHPRVRSQADGSHYTSTGALPLVPGVDGVGRDPDGRLRYFILPDTSLGAMAERTVVDVRRSVVLPDGTDPVAVAAAMNPAMSSWIALRRRTSFHAGQRVLVLGATGNAGRMAVQVATLFGAGSVVGVARDRDALAGLGADGANATVVLDGAPDLAERLGAAGAEVDVVIDYLWGEPAAAALAAIVPARADDDRQLTWIQIGSVAGPTSPIPSAALRATRLQIVGSGQGSVSPADIVAELPALAATISDGTLRVGARAVPLADVGDAWTHRATDGTRVVITPGR